MKSFVVMVVMAVAGTALADSVGDLKAWLAKPRADRPEWKEQGFAKVGLSKGEAEEGKGLLLADHAALIRETRAKEWGDMSMTIGDKTMKWKQRQFGAKPKEGWNLYISMHGGGGGPAQMNDQQWENQIKLYQPKDAIYIAPRAPTNNWNLWHEAHIDDLFDRLIEDAVVLGEVDVNHVYIMGYSAGGDGIYQLAPRMADRLAAASMMAGHPNDARPDGLRNIGFALHVGALDDGYGRNKVAGEWGKKLDELEKADAGGYVHQFQLHEGRAHWMNLEDKVAVDWMAGFTRKALPEKVVWRQSTRTHEAFYWLAVPAGTAKGGQLIVATRKGQEIEILAAEGVKEVIVRLNDAMVDMDQVVVVKFGGKELYKGVVKRTIEVLRGSAMERGDRDLTFGGSVTVQIEK